MEIPYNVLSIIFSTINSAGKCALREINRSHVLPEDLHEPITLNFPPQCIAHADKANKAKNA